MYYPCRETEWREADTRRSIWNPSFISRWNWIARNQNFEFWLYGEILHWSNWQVNKSLVFVYLANHYLILYLVLNRSSLNNTRFTLKDLNVGDVLTAHFNRFQGTQARVQIGENIRGFIDLPDLADIPLENPKKRFKEHQKIKVRVCIIFYIHLRPWNKLKREGQIVGETGKGCHNFYFFPLYTVWLEFKKYV